jgi:hypothetical protein
MGYGIDYGMGKTNIDHETGIRYGVIPANTVGEAWFDSSEAQYGDPHCPKCGNELPEGFDDCDSCACGHTVRFVGDECYSEEAQCFTYDKDGYRLTQGGDDCDIFVLKSPYYTKAAYCSPCAPGACYLTDSREDGGRAYCLGHDWFEDGKAPYPVYDVTTDAIVPSGQE